MLTPEAVKKISIPFKNILAFDKIDKGGNSPIEATSFKLSYVEETSKNVFEVRNANVTVDHGHIPDPQQVVRRVMDEAYQDSEIRKRLLVLINPHGGPGKAKQIYTKYAAPIFEAAECKVDVITTAHRYHAQEIARELDIEKYDAIVCCSGDGIPHEVLNGLAEHRLGKRALETVPICQLPCGSGNSMAVSMNGSTSPSLAALNMVKGRPMSIDLMCMTQGNNRVVTFLSQTYGLIADCDLGTENLRWMGGARFSVGAVWKALAGNKYPCEVSIKYAHEHKNDVVRHFSEVIARSRDSSIVSPVSPTMGGYSLSKPLKTPPYSTTHDLKYGTVNDPLPNDWKTIKLDELSLFYVGNMPWMSSNALVFPASLPTDGMLDLVMWDSSVGRVTSLNYLLKIENGEHLHSSKVKYSKILAYRLVPKIPGGYLSIDGESYPLEPFQVEVLPGAGCLLSESGVFANHYHDLSPRT